jgi:hypothetical protein
MRFGKPTKIAGIFTAAVCCCLVGQGIADAAFVTMAPPPVTGGLMVRLNGNNLSGAQASAVTRWVDQATSGAPGSDHQDFIGGSADGEDNNDPRLQLGLVMPNGLTANVLNINRGNVGSNNDSSTVNSQYMRSVTGGSDTATTFGADAAYELGQMTWVTVSRSYITTFSTSSTRRNQQFQTVIKGSYTAAVDTWSSATSWSGYDSAGASPPQNANADLYMELRDGAGAGSGRGIIDAIGGTGTDGGWYITATSWDPTTGNVRMVIYPQDGLNVLDVSYVQATPFVGGLTGHTLTWLGAESTSTTDGKHLHGDIAEVLIYNTALNTDDLNSVIAHLNTKYFLSTTTPGDYNGDGDVDAADYVVWRKDPGSFDPDAYDLWAANYGAGLGSGSSVTGTAVPEPTAIFFVIAALTVLVPSVRNGRNRNNVR